MAEFISSLTSDRSLENNLELLQQVALRNYLANGEESKPFYNLVTSGRIINELYQRVSGGRQAADYRKQCIANIVDFINKHPQASSSAIKKEVEEQVTLFALRVASL